MALMRQEGYDVQLNPESDIIWTRDEIKSLVIFSDGKTQNQNLYFRCGYTIPADKYARALELSNKYNLTYRFGKSYVENNAVVFQLTLSLDGGITRSRIISFFSNCKQFFAYWEKTVVAPLY